MLDPVAEPLPERVAALNPFEPIRYLSRIFVAHGHESADGGGPMRGRVFIEQVGRIVVAWRQFRDLVRCELREDDPGQERLMDEDDIALIFLVERGEFRRLVDLEESIVPFPEQTFIRTGHQDARIEVRPDDVVVDVSFHGEYPVLAHFAVAVHKRPECIDRLVIEGANIRVVDRPVTEIFIASEQEIGWFLQDHCVRSQPNEELRPVNCHRFSKRGSLNVRGKKEISSFGIDVETDDSHIQSNQSFLNAC